MTAVTGVRSHQVMLDVTGNNIANVNTTGFKKDFTIFQDLLYQTSQGASGPRDARGGINPAQVGLGVKVGAIETIHTQGPAQYTGNKSDMMIAGEGYFVLRDGTNRIYSRAGNFVLDAKSNLVHSGTGYSVQGYKMIRDPMNPQQFIQAGDLSDVNIPLGRKMEARQTEVVGYKCNLDSRSKAYLPIGFADIPYNDSRYARVKIDGVEYKTSYKTNLPASDGKEYLTLELDPENGAGNATKIVFDMTGIDAQSGLPVLTLNTSSSSNPLELKGTTTPLPFKVEYDNQTGSLKLVSASSTSTTAPAGSAIWATNLHESMNYSSFTVTNKSTNTDYPFIAEFDELRLDGSPTDIVLWYQENGVIKGPLTAKVSFKADGSFDSITDLSGTFPAGFKADNLWLGVSESGEGRTLQVRVAKDLANPDEKVYDAAANITQGGFHQTKLTVFDSKGDTHTLEVNFKKVTENNWRWEAFFVDENGKTIEMLTPTPNSGHLWFNGDGKIAEISSTTSPSEPIELYVPYSLIGPLNDTVLKLDFSGKAFGLDSLEGVTQYASESTSKGYYQDGYTMGVLKDYTVGKDGTITGIYTNDQNQPICRVALAQFANPQGLEKVGDTMFRESVNSGMGNINAAAVDGGGTIVGSTLEMSNVDLTEEFTRLILAQRGFQANTRVVTTSDQILEEVVNLKR
jgi:flagellar hook protein FlgE